MTRADCIATHKSESPGHEILFLRYTLGLLLALCVFAHTPVKADPAGLTAADWHYTLRPSDTLQDVGKRMLNRQYTWSDIVRYNRIDNVAGLQPGSIIKIPMSWLKFQPKPAKVLSVDGNVLIKRGQQAQFTLLKAQEAIRVGDEVMSRNGTALIKLADNSIIRVESDSHISFNRLSHFGDTGMVDIRIRLKRGGLINTVSPMERGSRYEISTPSAVAAVRGTEFRIRTDGNSSRVEVTEGSVEFYNGHRTLEVRAGEGAQASSQSALIQTRSLYDAPERLFESSVVDQLPTRLSWQPQPGADGYKYELRMEGQTGPVIESAELSQPDVEIGQLQNGEYEVAMRAVDGEGFEGIDDIAMLTVNVQGDKPLPLFPLPDSIVEAEQLAFRWKTLGSETRTKLQVARDQNFRDLVIDSEFDMNVEIKPENTLSPGEYYWRVQGLNPANIETASDTRSVSIRGLMDEVKILSVNYVDNQVGLFWNRVDNTNGYILQISDSADFSRIMREETISKPSAFLKLTAGKVYFARVKGIENDLFGSEYGPSRRLEIADGKQDN